MIIGASQIPATPSEMANIFHHLTNHILDDGKVGDNDEITIFNEYGVEMSPEEVKEIYKHLYHHAKASGDDIALRHAWFNSVEGISDEQKEEMFRRYEEEFGIDPTHNVRIRFNHIKPKEGKDTFEEHDHITWAERTLVTNKLTGKRNKISEESLYARNEKVSRITEHMIGQDTVIGAHCPFILKDLFDRGLNKFSRKYKKAKDQAERDQNVMLYRSLCEDFCKAIIQRNHNLAKDGLASKGELMSPKQIRKRFEMASNVSDYKRRLRVYEDKVLAANKAGKSTKNIKHPQPLYQVLLDKNAEGLTAFGDKPKAKYNVKMIKTAAAGGWDKLFKKKMKEASNCWRSWDKKQNSFKDHLKDHGFLIKTNAVVVEYESQLDQWKIGLLDKKPKRPKEPLYTLQFMDGEETRPIGSALTVFGTKRDRFEKRYYPPVPKVEPNSKPSENYVPDRKNMTQAEHRKRFKESMYNASQKKLHKPE